MKRMTSLKSIRLLSSLLLVLSFSLAADAQRGRGGDRPDDHRGEARWERLGQVRPNGRRDHDLIRVNARGGLRAIQMKVQGGAIGFQRVVVHFQNGADTDLQIRDRIEAGSETRVIDLPGDQRKIRSVEFWYGSENWGRQAPTLVLYGRR